ncbi:MAG: ADP-ribosylglycohydrolase family protein [Solirubrobacterales bacterium]|nr:ADP-ribosylglycohydrolase family protein [Solirubrobacterales bacterium]
MVGSSAAPLDRALVSLEGLSLGDAFGESFFTADAVERVESKRLGTGQWTWTDDTAMAISIVETLCSSGRVEQDELAQRFAARYAAEPDRGYSPATRAALAAVGRGRYWRTVSKRQFSGRGSFGNGAAMRSSVVGAWFAEDLELAVEQARRAAEVTHAHLEGIAGAIAITVAAALACRGTECPAGARFIETILGYLPDGEVKARVHETLLVGSHLPIGEVVAAIGNGAQVSAQDTVPLVLWCASQHLSDYESALWATVSALGDRDTTCAMVGGIIACSVGREGLPSEWLRRREAVPLAIPRQR